MKTLLKIITSIVILIFLTCELSAQSKITVDATGEIQVPADIVNLIINIRVTEETPSRAFEEHKRQEGYLVSLIREKGLSGEKLSFQPMGISAYQDRERRGIRTNQQVHLTLEDFSMYEEIQVLLIENNFENFSARFGSTQSEEAAGEALDIAIRNARNKASRIAENVGKTLGEVDSIEHTAQPVGVSMRFESVMQAADSGSMMQFEQSIPVTSSIRIIYNLD